MADRYRAIRDIDDVPLIDWYREYSEHSVSSNSVGFDESALEAVQRMLGTPPYIYSAGLLEELLRLGRRRVYRQLEKLLISGAATCVRVPKPDGGWADWWSLTDAPIRATSGSLLHQALIVSIGDWLRTHTRLLHESEVHDSILEPSSEGPDLWIVGSNELTLAVEIETGLKHRWFSLDEAILEFENILRRNARYDAILMIVPTERLKTQIETLVGRREHRLTVMTVRELHTKFDPYYSNLWQQHSQQNQDNLT